MLTTLDPELTYVLTADTTSQPPRWWVRPADDPAAEATELAELDRTAMALLAELIGLVGAGNPTAAVARLERIAGTPST